MTVDWKNVNRNTVTPDMIPEAVKEVLNGKPDAMKHLEVALVAFRQRYPRRFEQLMHTPGTLGMIFETLVMESDAYGTMSEEDLNSEDA